jgi:hypothetical protein
VVLTECEFVSAGPSTALPVTAAGLLDDLRAEEGQSKYVEKEVVLRAEVRKVDWDGTVVSFTVGDPGVTGGPGLKATLNPQSEEVGAEPAKVKVGSVVVLLGEAERVSGGRIWGFRLLADPPEGVALPGAAKK